MFGSAQTTPPAGVQIPKTQRGRPVTLGLGHDWIECRPAPRGVGVAAPMPSPNSRALVLGFGNVLLSDDGAGVRLVERLRSELGSHAAEFVDAGTLSFSLLSYVEATDSLLVVDAADLNSAHGTVRLFEGGAMDDFLKSARRRTVHEVGLIDLLDMARLQDCLPGRRALLCVQPGVIDWCDTLSASVAAALPEAARQARVLLHRWTLT
jgi:hydrogenase maturation protease